jgi:putative ABC transport system substrate-binding protein
MRRRELLALLSLAGVAHAFAAHAQQKATPVIGVLGSTSSGPYAVFVAAFRQGLTEIGYTDGRNVAVVFRWADGHYDRLPTLATDLVARKVDVIVTSGGTPSAQAAKDATSTIPIVFATGGDAVADGLVTTLARPGGNVTGVSFLTAELDPKRIQLLTELVPAARLIALLVNPANPQTDRIVKSVQEVAQSKAVQLAVLKAADEAEIGAAFAAVAQMHADALIIASDPFFFSRRDQIVALASRDMLPTIYQLREFADAGGLISYGASVAAMYRQAGIYAGEILNGTPPSKLPVRQPTTFELVINLKTAKALGLTVPQSLLARADEVIE